jgi:pimeloyl-ACP methyl ester carboxylesterase
MTPVLSRHFATVGERQVHYRRAGSGPVVMLLHQTPTSSAELLPLLFRLAPRFTVIAPDMPGYGASDPLGDVPMTVAALADNVAGLMETLGVPAASVYGFHTGASVATALARRHPGRVVVSICEGLLCLDESERSEFLARYIEPFVPRWDGGHLAWLWTRLKDQSIFFPWHERTGAARLDLDGASKETLEASARDWLRSGASYSDGYVAAITYDPREDLPAITTRHHVLCRRSDPLAMHLQRLPPATGNLTVHRYDTTEEGFAEVLRILAESPHGPSAPVPPPAAPLPGRVWHDYVSSGDLPLRVSRAGPPNTRVTLIQHDARASLRSVAQLVSGLGRTRSTLAVELPGHGETGLPARGGIDSLEYLATSLRGVLDSLGVTSCDLIGFGAGAAVQIELARSSPGLAASLTLVAPLDVTSEPVLRSGLLESYRYVTGDFDGGYLLRAWHEVRDHLLFFPWYERRRACAVLDSPMLEPAFLQARTVDALLAGKAGIEVRKAEVCYALRERLAALPLKPRFAAALWEPRYTHAKALAGAGNRFLQLSRDPGQWAGQLG